MFRYIRPKQHSATVFLTVNLADRGSNLLTQEIDALRRAASTTMRERPFAIDAWVVMPDHLHCIWQMPPGDADFSVRWSIIKARFSRALPKGRRRASHIARRNAGFGNGGFGNITSVIE